MMQLTRQNLFRGSFWLLVIYILVLAAGILRLMLLALLLAVLAAPLSSRLQNIRLNKRRLFSPALAAAAAFILLLGGGGVSMWLICAPLLSEFSQFYKELPVFLQLLKQLAAAAGQAAAESFASQFDVKERLEYLLLFAEGFAADGAVLTFQVLQKLTLWLVTAAGRLLDIVLIVMLAFYFLRDYGIILNGFLELFSSGARDTVRTFLQALGQMLTAFVYGQLTLCLTVGIGMFAGLSLLGVKYPLLVGAAAAVFEAVPVVGPFISAVLAVLLALTVSAVLAGQTALFCLGLQLVENNLLAPRIMGHSLKLPPAVVLLSLLIGGHLFGIMGMLAALPTAAGLRLLIEYYWNMEDV